MRHFSGGATIFEIHQLQNSILDWRDLLVPGLLRGREVVCLSTMKAPGWFAELWLGGAHKILMRRALFHFVGIHKVKFLQLAEMEDPTGRRQNRAMDKVGRYFRKAG